MYLMERIKQTYSGSERVNDTSWNKSKLIVHTVTGIELGPNDVFSSSMQCVHGCNTTSALY